MVCIYILRILCGQARRGQNVDNNICGYGGTGRRAGLRILWIPVQVQLLLSAPTKIGHLRCPIFVGMCICNITGVDGGGASESERFACGLIKLRF